jgi:hypothetical protein
MIKVTLVQALRPCTSHTAHRRSWGIALPFLDHGTRRGWGVKRHAPAALPPGKTRYPLYRRLGGPQGRSGQVRKISPPPWFDPRNVQLVASRYTDYATRARRYNKTVISSGLFKSRLVTKQSKLKLYRTVIRPIVTYASETWVLKEAIIQKLLVYERKILRRIFGPTKENQIWRVKTNE